MAPPLEGPKVVAYSRTQNCVQSLQQLEPQPALIAGWPKFERIAGNAQILIVCIQSAVDWPHLDSLRCLRRKYPVRPLIVLTRGRWEDARHLAPIHMDSLLSFNQLFRLQEILNRAISGGLRSQMARLVDKNPSLTHHERYLMKSLLTSEKTARTCQEWASLAFCSPSKLKYHFRKRLSACGLPVGFMIKVNLLAAAMDRAPHTQRDTEIAAIADLDRRTVARMRAQLASPAPLAAHPDILVRRFATRLEQICTHEAERL